MLYSRLARAQLRFQMLPEDSPLPPLPPSACLCKLTVYQSPSSQFKLAPSLALHPPDLHATTLPGPSTLVPGSMQEPGPGVTWTKPLLHLSPGTFRTTLALLTVLRPPRGLTALCPLCLNLEKIHKKAGHVGETRLTSRYTKKLSYSSGPTRTLKTCLLIHYGAWYYVLPKLYTGSNYLPPASAHW